MLTWQKAPLPSHIMTHPELADSLEAIAKDGHKGYYTGRIAQGQHFTSSVETVS
jgi:gamma-glutamyltranspeptidase